MCPMPKREPKDGVPDLMLAKQYVFHGLTANGGEAKQYYLIEIGRALGMDMDWQYEYMKSSPDECRPWSKGRPPK